jgi:uncharacterized SAM-binding protein YcdF (DUF218 family)
MTILLLTKGLPLYVYPLGAAIFVSATALLLSCTSWWRIGLVQLGLALIALWIAATPVFANWLNWRLESEFPPVDVGTLPQSNAVILLGGVGLDFDNPTNRIVHALQIYRAGKAPLIVISGGNPDPLVKLGAPRSILIVEPESRNTRENAVNTAAIFKAHGWKNGLLVTSAIHMPRALAAFQRVGLNVAPAATGIDPRLFRPGGSVDPQPNKEALLQTAAAIKEIVGLLVYRCLGWA